MAQFLEPGRSPSPEGLAYGDATSPEGTGLVGEEAKETATEESRYLRLRDELRKRVDVSLSILQTEFAKKQPSYKFLAMYLDDVQQLARSMTAVVQDQRRHLLTTSRFDQLDELRDYETQFRRDVGVMADVSAMLERSSYADYESSSRPSSRAEGFRGEQERHLQPDLMDNADMATGRTGGRLSESLSPVERTTGTSKLEPMTMEAAHQAGSQPTHHSSIQLPIPRSTALEPSYLCRPPELVSKHLPISASMQQTPMLGLSATGSVPTVVGSTDSNSWTSAYAAPTCMSSSSSATSIHVPGFPLTVPSAYQLPSTSTDAQLSTMPHPQVNQSPVYLTNQAVGSVKSYYSPPQMPPQHASSVTSVLSGNANGMAPSPASRTTGSFGAYSGATVSTHNAPQVQLSAPLLPLQSVCSPLQTVQPPPQNPAHLMLKPIELPRFNGKAQEYSRWRSRFKQYIHPSWPEEYKLVRLREAVQGGSANDLIADLLDGPGAYLAAWTELESWFGGTDRQLEQQIKDIMTQARIVSERDLDGIQKFAIKLRSTLSNIRSCGDQPSRELCIIATEKIPRSMLVRFFEKHGSGTTDVTVFATWLLNQVKLLRHAGERAGEAGKQNTPNQGRKLHQTLATATTMDKQQDNPHQGKKSPPAKFSHNCRKCNGSHHISRCNSFKELSVSKRYNLVRLLSLCVNCMSDGHWARDCTASGCAECGNKHHSLLHSPEQTNKKTTNSVQVKEAKRMPTTSATDSSLTIVDSSTTGQDGNGLTSFMTVPAAFESKSGSNMYTANGNVLLDSASTCSYVSQQLARRLHLHGPLRDMSVAVLGGATIAEKREVVTLRVRHQDSSDSTELEAYVLPDITTDLPIANWSALKSQWPHMADIDFPTVSRSTIDALVGLNAAKLHSAQEERIGRDGEPIARRTPLGWLCFGPAICQEAQRNQHSLLAVETTDLQTLVRNFWDLEAVGMQPTSSEYMSPDERMAEEATSQRLHHSKGRFEMGVPWIDGEKPKVVSNRVQAESRLHSLFRSLQRRPTVQLRYAKVLDDYLQKSYIRILSTEEVDKCGADQWYLPHFPVIREDKATTKVRVVFDAAAKFNGTAINEHMFAGPKLQNDLVKILLRFCQEPVALIADISEMFLQVALKPSDRRYHRFLWKTGDGITVYEFARLAFGIKASPYLAGRALLETANKFGSRYDPEAGAIVNKAFYVDDMLKSLPRVDQAIRIRSQLQELLREGGFNLRKWLSNSREVMDSVPPDLRATTDSKAITEQDASGPPSLKTLGVTWMVKGDYFTFHYHGSPPREFTKRGVLSRMASLFDPRGQLAPFTIRGKLMFQRACLIGIGWDAELPPEQRTAWKTWFAEFEQLSSLRIDRCFKGNLEADNISLHVFTDASDLAYAAAVYVRVEDSTGRVNTTLAMAKARPAPIKRRSIPLLELQGAVLGARLGKYVGETLCIPSDSIRYWTDSMNVIYWIRSHSRRFRVEVGNRVSEIQQGTGCSQWRHVPGTINPADLPSRGVPVARLLSDTVWWKGPEFLCKSADEWPQRQIVVPDTLPSELKKATSGATLLTPQVQECAFRLRPEKFSSWTRLVRVTAWCRRFIGRLRKCRTAHGEKDGASASVHIPPTDQLQYSALSDGNGKQKSTSTGKPGVAANVTFAVPELTITEIGTAEIFWISQAQQEKYGEVFHDLRLGHELPASCPLLKLQPRLDNKSGIPFLRVSGRLRTAHHLSSEFRSPIILPPRNRVTELIVTQEDQRCRHSIGTNHLLSNLADRYWLVKGKQTVKSHRHSCVGCQKIWRKPSSPRIGLLPDFRTKGPLLAFSRTAVDFAGPFLVKRGRGKVQEKRYVAVFTCLQSRACHLEMVTSLDTVGFKMALTRFCKRRGTPQMLLTDNGTNFVATDRELREAVSSLDHAALTADGVGQGIEWLFNPPRSPHFGGVFERMVRSMKQVLQTILYQAGLTDEELQTALVQAEALLNSRPLTVLSDDADDLVPLTPAHFLIGHSCVATAMEEVADDERINPRHRWRVLQDIIQRVWRRWVREIVARANLETKWQRDSGVSVKEGTVLLVLDDASARANWPLGRVVRIYPGKDGRVRVVDVLVKGKVYKRNVHRLVPLDVDPGQGGVCQPPEVPSSAAVALEEVM